MATTAAELGTGSFDGQLGYIEYGGRQDRMRWIESAGVWVGEEHLAVCMRDGWPMTTSSTANNPAWTYFRNPQGSAGATRSWGYAPQSALGIKTGIDAGLTLQERLTADYWAFSATSVYSLGLVWYGFDQGDTIDPSIVVVASGAGRNLGAVLNTGPATTRTFQTTGWVNSPISTPTKPHLMPHLYAIWVSGTKNDARMDYVKGEWRWVYDPTP